MAEALFPDGGRACGAGGDYSACPLIAPLKARLNAHPLQYVEQLCRCSKPYGARTFTPTATSDGAYVRVDLALEGGRQSLDVIMDRSAGVWLAADITCPGHGTSTSVFSTAPSLCFAPS